MPDSNSPQLSEVVRRLEGDLAEFPEDVLELLDDYRDDHLENTIFRKYWDSAPELYAKFTEKLISTGHPRRAYDLAVSGLTAHQDNPELMYLAAQALARGKSAERARSFAKSLLRLKSASDEIRARALSILGKLSKDELEMENLDADVADEGFGYYRKAYALSGDSDTAINAATLALVAGKKRRALIWADHALKKSGEEMRSPDAEKIHIALATQGEAQLILGRNDAALTSYKESIASAKKAAAFGDLVSFKRNLLLIGDRAPNTEEILAMFDVIGRVVVFAGCMIDKPDSPVPSLPSDNRIMRELENSIRHAIEELNVKVGVCSAACGSDLLFAKTLLEQDAELHIVLPFAKEDFLETCVLYAQGTKGSTNWAKEFDRVMNDAKTKVHYATPGSHIEGDTVVFDYADKVLQGLAITRAREFYVEPQALYVTNSACPDECAQSARFRDGWPRESANLRTIDIAEFKEWPRLCGKDQKSSRKKPPPNSRSILKKGSPYERSVKAMLFSDMKNYSKLREEQAPFFVEAYLSEIASLIDKSIHPPILKNTWGDGLFLVFDQVSHCAEFALNLIEAVNRIDFEEHGLPADTSIRIGVHAGPVYSYEDKILNGRKFIGTHITRAARIEPVSAPGCAYASEQFAALLTLEAGDKFRAEYVGREKLAKDYDEVGLYMLKSIGK